MHQGYGTLKMPYYFRRIIESGLTEDFFNNPKHQLTKDYLSGSFS
jgi:ABC-type phosphate transport system ATPase subunit